MAGLLRFVPLGLYACFAIRREPRLRALYVAVAVVVALWVLDAWVQVLTGWSLAGHAEAGAHLRHLRCGQSQARPDAGCASPFVLWVARERWGVPRSVAGRVRMLLGAGAAGRRALGWLCYALVVLAFAWREAGSA